MIQGHEETVVLGIRGRQGIDTLERQQLILLDTGGHRVEGHAFKSVEGPVCLIIHGGSNKRFSPGTQGCGRHGRRRRSALQHFVRGQSAADRAMMAIQTFPAVLGRVQLGGGAGIPTLGHGAAGAVGQACSMVGMVDMIVIAVTHAHFLGNARQQLFTGDVLAGGALAADRIQHAGPAHGLGCGTLAEVQHSGLAGHAVQILQQLQQVGRIGPDGIIRHQRVPVLCGIGTPAGHMVQQWLACFVLIQRPGGTQQSNAILEGHCERAVLVLGGQQGTDFRRHRLFAGFRSNDTGQSEGTFQANRFIHISGEGIQLHHGSVVGADKAGTQRLRGHHGQGRFVKNRLERHRFSLHVFQRKYA